MEEAISASVTLELRIGTPRAIGLPAIHRVRRSSLIVLGDESFVRVLEPRRRPAHGLFEAPPHWIVIVDCRRDVDADKSLGDVVAQCLRLSAYRLADGMAV